MKPFNLIENGGLYRKNLEVVARHDQYTVGETTGGLSVVFAILCIVDLFGVFPIVTLPKNIIACGLYGVPLVIAVFTLQLYTAMLLGRCWILAHQIMPTITRNNRFPYAAVAELAFGNKMRKVVTFLIDATVFGAGIPNFIVASQSMQLFWWKITGGEVGVSYCHWMLLIGLLLCPVMWLGSPKDMKPIAVISVLIVTTVALSTWSCILMDDVSPPSTGGVLEHQPSVHDFVVAYGIIAFQFDIHPMLLTIQVDMKDSRRIHAAVLSGFVVTGIMFAITTLLAAYRYGTHVDNNILQGIPPSIPLYVLALLVTLQLCLSSAVGNSALFQHIEALFKIPRDFCVQRCIIRSSIVFLAVFLGESIPRFEVVMGFIGTTLTGPLMFIFPPLFFIKLCHIKTKLSNSVDNTNYTNNINMVITPPLRTTNGNAPNSKNGDLSKLPLIIQNALRDYKTFVRDTQRDFSNDPSNEYRIRWYDVAIAIIIMLIGVISTAVATYSSWSYTFRYATFTQPCLLNATAAARIFIDTTNYLM